MNGLCLLALSVLLSVPVALSADGPGVDELLEHNEQARGGLQGWRKVQTLALAGEMVVQLPAKPGEKAPDPMHVPFAMGLKRPHKLRLELRFKDGVGVQVFDGTTGYLLHQERDQWAADPFSDAQNVAFAHQEDLDGPLLDARAKGTEVELEGQDHVAGKPAWRLKLKTRDGTVRHVWLDAGTFLEAKMDGFRQVGGQLRPAEIYFSDYRPVEGLLVAHAIETKAAGVGGSEVVHVQVAIINSDIPEERFRKPPRALLPVPAGPPRNPAATPAPEGGPAGSKEAPRSPR
jgi:hypothetical protein